MSASVRCPACNASVSPQAKFCEVCGASLRTNKSPGFSGDNVFVKSNIDASTQHTRIDRQINIQLSSPPAQQDFAESVEQARFLLQTKAFKAAIEQLQSAIKRFPREPVLYYYLVIANLSGRQPHQLSFDEAEGLDKMLKVACELGKSHTRIFYLWAWFKEDIYNFHHTPISPPSIQELIEYAEDSAISQAEAFELLEIAGISNSMTAQRILQRKR